MVGGPIFIEMVRKMDNIINLAGLCVVGMVATWVVLNLLARHGDTVVVLRPGPGQAQATEYFSHHRVTIILLSTRFSRRPDPLMMGRVPCPACVLGLFVLPLCH